MAKVRFAFVLVLIAVCVSGASFCFGAGCYPRPCVPDRPVPPESVGPINVPFDVPIWPTLLKTEFNIIPWVSFGKASVCLPGTCTAIEFPCPSLSLKPLPVWFPWLRPLDVECTPQTPCAPR